MAKLPMSSAPFGLFVFLDLCCSKWKLGLDSDVILIALAAVSPKQIGNRLWSDVQSFSLFHHRGQYAYIK